MDVIDAVRRRRSTELFEPDGLLLSRAEIESLIADACLCPSEFDLQPWRFIVVRDLERKEVLYECTDGQEKIRNAASIVIICGDTLGFEGAPEETGSRYRSSERERVLLAVRNAAFAGMTLMLLALERGIASAPIFSYSEQALREAFHIRSRYVPVMLVALGLPSTASAQAPCRERGDVKNLVSHEDMAGQDF